MEKLALTFAGLSILPLILTETHWLVTENGRIHSVAESLFNMAQSHDLVQFLKQEDRVKKSDDAKDRLTSQKTVIRHHEQKDDPQIESRLMQTDPDCILAGKPLAQQDLFLSTIVPLENFGIRLEDRIGRVSKMPTSGSFTLTCSSYSLPFSTAAFEHLEGVRERKTLAPAPDPSMAQIAFDGWINTTDFAHAVANAMHQHQDDWLLYTLASYYFRFSGDLTEAVECLRRALHFAPREYAAIPLLSLGNVLHQSSHSKDAAVVMDTAVAFNDSIPQLFLTAGHAYTVSLQYEKAIAAFERISVLDDTYSAAKLHQAAVRCHQKLESALETQHQNLQKTLSELQSYQVRLKNFQTLHEEMLRHVVDSETRQLSSLTFDHVVYGPLEGLFCNTTSSNGQTYIDCDIEDFVTYKAAKRQVQDGGSSAKPKGEEKDSAPDPKNVPDQENEASTLAAATPEMKAKANVNEEKKYLASLEIYRNLEFSTPTLRRKYSYSDASRLAPKVDTNEFWPTDEDCQRTAVFPKPEAIPNLFISPGNKGFDVKQLLTKYLKLNDTYRHPLPWYPPFCSPHLQNKPELHLDCCDHLLGVQRAKVRERERLLPETSLRQVVGSLAMGLSNSDAEFGQRVLTLMNYNIVAKWISYNLAALYWRLNGVTAEAAACLRLSLAEEEVKKYADVALFQLSYLAYNAGNRIDDAVNLLRQALEIDEQEPTTHFLLSSYLVAKENFTGAAQHLRKVLELEPQYPNGQGLMKTLKCKLKALAGDHIKPPVERLPLTKCPEKNKGPKFFCMREDGEERCYLEERMLPGASVEQSDMMCPACNMPHCVKPPPLASMFLSMADRRAKTQSPPKGAAKSKIQPPEIQSAALLAQIEPEVVEAEMSLIDASMQPGSVFNVRDTTFMEQQALRALERKSEGLLESVEEDNSGDGRPSMLDHLKATLAPKANEEPPKISPPTKIKLGVAIFTDIDSPLPDVLPVPPDDMVKAASSLVNLPSTTAECVFWKNRVKVEQPISTYLSISAKGINVQSFVDFASPPPKDQLEPRCPSEMPGTMWTMDHLHAYQFRHNLSHYRPESGLKDAFQKLGGTKESIEVVACRVAHAMKLIPSNSGDAEQMWILTAMAALYWRVQGNASMAIDCLRHSVHAAPYFMKDLALISLANVYHQSGFLHSALIAAGAALHVSPKFVVVHFTLANIYAALGDWDRAMMFYYSTLSLQGNLEAAKDRIRAVYCAAGYQ